MNKKVLDFFKNYKREAVVPLFAETIQLTQDDISNVIFNQGYEDTATSYSFRKLYMEYLDDPTEVTFVDNVLAGKFYLLENIKKSNTLKKFYKSVREEAERRRIAKNVAKITEIANSGNEKLRMTALKYLCDKGFIEESKGIQRGRPSKEEIEGALLQAVQERSEYEEDFARITQTN